MVGERVDYRDVVQRPEARQALDPQTEVEFNAIDRFVEELKQDPWFTSQFEGKGLNSDEVMTGVRNLETALVAVRINSSGEFEREHWQALGQRLLDPSKVVDREVWDRLAGFVINEDSFDIEFSAPKV